MKKRLEDALKMEGFQDMHLKAFLEIVYTASEIRHLQYKFFKRFGLSPEQYNILRILRGSYPNELPIHEIRTRMVDKTPHTTRMIDKLEKRQLAYRKRNNYDRRQIGVKITQEGINLMNYIDTVLPELLQIIHKLDEEEANTLIDLLEKIRG